jgi:hypothetical protein
LILLAALFLIVWLPDTPNDKLNKIQPGMSTKNVQEILGQPAQGSVGKIPPPGPVLWNFPEGVAYVYFDSEGKATHKGWWEHHSDERSLKDRIRDWLAN